MYLQFLNRDGVWPTQEPPWSPCRFSTTITSGFLNSAHERMNVTSHLSVCTVGAIWDCGESLVHSNCLLIFRSFSWLLLIWFHSKVATKEFSFHSTPNTLLFLSDVTGLFLHVRCAPQQNSQWQFWASVCVCVCIYCTLNFLKGKLPTTAYLTWNIWWWNTHLNAVIPACKFFEVPGFKIVIEGPGSNLKLPETKTDAFKLLETTHEWYWSSTGFRLFSS